MILPKTFIGSTLLIAGSTIGAGMLALPVIVGQVGFWPALAVFAGVWFYMLLAGLLLCEALSWKTQQVNVTHKGLNTTHGQLLSTVEKALGKSGRYLVIGLFLGLFSCIMMAYLDKGGGLIAQLIQSVLDKLLNDPFILPTNWGAVILAGVSFFVLRLRYGVVDVANRLGMLLLAVSFVVLIALCFSNIDMTHYDYVQHKGFAFLVPFLITSFGFHNMLPAVSNYSGGFSKTTIWAIVLGSFLPLLVYVLWTGAVLGVISADELAHMFKAGKIATQVLAEKTALTSSSEMIGVSFGMWASLFAFAAIITSVFGQGLSVSAFVREFMPRLREDFTLILFFGFCLAGVYGFMDIFMTALEFAGGFFAIVLFGIIPASIVMIGRRNNWKADFKVPLPLWAVALIAVLGGVVFTLEVLKVLHIIQL